MAYSDSLYRDTLLECRMFLVENLTNASRIERLIRRMYVKGHIKEEHRSYFFDEQHKTDRMTLLLEYLFDSDDIDMRKVFRDFVSTIKDGKQLFIAKKLEESLDELKKNGEPSEEEMKITRGATSKQSGNQTANMDLFEKTNLEMMNPRRNKPKKAYKNYDETTKGSRKQNLELLDAIVRACNSNHARFVEMKLRTLSFNVNTVHRGILTALNVASAANSKETVAMLLHEKDVDVNLSNVSGMTALMYAALYNARDSIDLLLKHNKIDVNFADETGVTALMHAANANAAEVVSLLLSDSRVNPNPKDKTGVNVLMVACLSKSTESLQLLLEDKRIYINAKDDRGISAIMVTCKFNSYKALAMLLKDPRVDATVVNTQSISGLTSLMTACSSQAYRCVLLLLEDKRIDVNVRDFYGRTAFTFAIDNKAEKCIELLKIDPRVDLKARDYEGQTVSDRESNSVKKKKPYEGTIDFQKVLSVLSLTQSFFNY